MAVRMVMGLFPFITSTNLLKAHSNPTIVSSCRSTPPKIVDSVVINTNKNSKCHVIKVGHICHVVVCQSIHNHVCSSLCTIKQTWGNLPDPSQHILTGLDWRFSFLLKVWQSWPCHLLLNPKQALSKGTISSAYGMVRPSNRHALRWEYCTPCWSWNYLL